MYRGVVYIVLVILFIGVFMLFWYNDWVYSLPTPVPENHLAVPFGESIDLSTKFKFNNSKPVLLHFFNPDCPCSRFNMPHFKSLVKEFGTEVNFAIVVISNKQYDAEEISDRFEVNIPVFSDTTIAALCGVYSTPQAVIIDTYKKLYFRGNYNKSRYCTEKKSNYAQLALQALLRKDNHSTSPAVFKAYGCELPRCTLNDNKP